MIPPFLARAGALLTSSGGLALAALLCAGPAAAASDAAGNTAEKPAARSAAVLLKQALSNAQSTAEAEQPLERAEIRNTPVKTQGDSTPGSLLPPPDALPGNTPSAAAPVRPNPNGADRRGNPGRTDAANRQVEAQDPRTPPPADGKGPSAYEPTALTVNRVFVASNSTDDARKISMAVPVYYESRLLGMEKDKQRAASHLLERLNDFQKRVAAMQKEGADLLKEWNDVVGASVPKDLLMADSPSLTENQGVDRVNRPNDEPGFEAGKNVLVQLKNTGEGAK